MRGALGLGEGAEGGYEALSDRALGYPQCVTFLGAFLACVPTCTPGARMHAPTFHAARAVLQPSSTLALLSHTDSSHY